MARHELHRRLGAAERAGGGRRAPQDLARNVREDRRRHGGREPPLREREQLVRERSAGGGAGWPDGARHAPERLGRGKTGLLLDGVL